MISVIDALFWLLNAFLTLMRWAIVISAVISWLVAFDIINLRNRNAFAIADFFERVTRPVLRPFQRIIPTLGGVDVSPIVAYFVIAAIQRFILREVHDQIVRFL